MDFISKGGLQKAKSVAMERLKYEGEMTQLRSTPAGREAGGQFYFDPSDDARAGIDLFTVVREIFSWFLK